MTTVLTTAVLSKPDSSVDKPYKITLTPSSPALGEEVTIGICSSVFDWVLYSPYGDLSSKSTEPAAQVFSELLSVNGETVSTGYPVAKLSTAIASTPIIRNNVFLYPPGDPGLRNSLRRINDTIHPTYNDMYGSGEIFYETFRAQKWRLSGRNNPGQFVLFASSAAMGIVDEPILFTVSETGTTDTSGPSIVTVQAKDFCTDLPIEGAAVYVDGDFIGNADINGKVFVGSSPAGSYGVKIQASGYLPTDSDDLSNDSYTI